MNNDIGKIKRDDLYLLNHEKKIFDRTEKALFSDETAIAGAISVTALTVPELKRKVDNLDRKAKELANLKGFLEGKLMDSPIVYALTRTLFSYASIVLAGLIGLLSANYYEEGSYGLFLNTLKWIMIIGAAFGFGLGILAWTEKRNDINKTKKKIEDGTP